jgi:hypothetical protein
MRRVKSTNVSIKTDASHLTNSGIAFISRSMGRPSSSKAALERACSPEIGVSEGLMCAMSKVHLNKDRKLGITHYSSKSDLISIFS